MIHASASASRPTLSRDVQDSTIARASAASVTAPRLICRLSRARAGATRADAPSFERHGQQREHDHRDDREPEVLLDDGQVAEEVAEQAEAPHPENTAADVEREKPRIVHAADAGHERGERAHDRYEAR